MTSAAAVGPTAAFIAPRRAWWALAVLILGIAMALLDTTIVNVALPTIKTQHRRGRGHAQLDHLRLRARLRPRA